MMSDADVKLKWKVASQERSFQIWRPPGSPKVRRPLLPRDTPPSSDTYLASQHVRNSSTIVPGRVKMYAGTCTGLKLSGQEVRHFVTSVHQQGLSSSSL